MTFKVIGAALAALIVTYFMGSINFAVIISRFMKGDDVREHGSGNAGSTNMLRTYGKSAAALTFCGDLLKGTLAVLMGRLILSFVGYGVYGGYIGGLGALLGHKFPVYFNFKGGKGVATGLGLLAALNPLAFLIVSVVFIPLVPITGYVSIASILGAGFFPVVLGLVDYFQGHFSLPQTLCAFVLGGFIVANHRENIVRLLNGTERSIKKKKEGGC